MIRKLLLPFMCLLFAFSAIGQKNDKDYFLLYDSAWKQVTDAKGAFYFIHVYKLNDTAWRQDYYNMAGPRLATETYKDEAGTKPNGSFSWYNAFGYLDSSGYVQDGKKHGDWYYYQPHKFSVKAIWYKNYDRGILVEEKDPEKMEKEQKQEKDKREEATFNGMFRDFLEQNLQFPERSLNMGLGNVVTLHFVLDEKGKVSDVQVMRSIEYSLDVEAERVLLLSSGRWKPGKINGKAVRTFHQQSINFVIAKED